MNPDPMGLATGNSAIKEDMNMKTKPSFNILIYGFYCLRVKPNQTRQPFRLSGPVLRAFSGLISARYKKLHILCRNRFSTTPPRRFSDSDPDTVSLFRSGNRLSAGHCSNCFSISYGIFSKNTVVKRMGMGLRVDEEIGAEGGNAQSLYLYCTPIVEGQFLAVLPGVRTWHRQGSIPSKKQKSSCS